MASPLIVLYQKNNETKVLKGTSTVIEVALYFTPETTAEYEMEIMIPPQSWGHVSLCNVRLLRSSLPCLNVSYISTTMSSSQGNGQVLAKVALGNVTNPFSHNQTLLYENKVRILDEFPNV